MVYIYLGLLRLYLCRRRAATGLPRRWKWAHPTLVMGLPYIHPSIHSSAGTPRSDR